MTDAVPQKTITITINGKFRGETRAILDKLRREGGGPIIEAFGTIDPIFGGVKAAQEPIDWLRINREFS